MWYKRDKLTGGFVILVILFFIAIWLISGAIGVAIWNSVMVTLFGLPTITFGQMIGTDFFGAYHFSRQFLWLQEE